MAAPSTPPNAHIRVVVFCDEQPEPHTLPDMLLPRSVDSLKRVLEERLGLRAKLLSYWSHSRSCYQLLRDVRELLQDEAVVADAAPSSSASPARRGDKARGDHTPTPAPRVYGCQLWVETVLLQLEPLDPRRDAAEYDELCRHVSRWLGNKHIGYEVRDAVRVRCPFLTRMFDETRRQRLEGNQDKVQLLYYSNNVWSVRDVLQYGFLLSRGVPKSMTAVVEAQAGAGSDLSSTAETRLSIPVPRSTQGPSSQASAPQSPLPSSSSLPLEDALDSQAHPFIFTSSMLGPHVKQLNRPKAAHKVLLCEVAPGRRFMVDHSLTGEQTDRQSFPNAATVKVPRGFDSACYMHSRESKGPVQSGDESSTKVEDLAVVQVQVLHSYQALPRYLLTVVPTGGPPPPQSSFDSTMSATNSPVRLPGSTARAAAAAAAAAAASSPRSSRSSRLKDWFTTSPFRSCELETGAGEAGNQSSNTPVRRQGAASAPPDVRLSPRSTAESRFYRLGDSTPRRAASTSATNPRTNVETSPLSPYRGRSVAGGGGAAAVPASPSYRNSGTPYPTDSPFLSQGMPSANARASSTRERSKEGMGLAPPTPPSSSSRPDAPAAAGARFGVLYSGLQHQQQHQQQQQQRQQYSNSYSSHSPERGEAEGHGKAPSRQTARDGSHSSSRPLVPGQRSAAADALSPLPQQYQQRQDPRRLPEADSSAAYAVPPLPPPASSILRRSGPSLAGEFLTPADPPSRSAAPPQPPAAFNHFLCAVHPRQLQSLYCTVCEELTCPYCASVGDHRNHVVVEAADQVSQVHAQVHQLHEELRHWLAQYRQTEQELRAEQASWAARRQRELRSLQQNFAALRQALQHGERDMLQAVQQRTCPPPLAEATAVIGKYSHALAPIDAALKRYHSALAPSHTAPGHPSAQAAHSANSAAGGGSRGATRSVPEMLHFLRTAPPLVRQVQSAFVHQHKEEERRLRDAVADYHARLAAIHDAGDHVDWAGLRRLLENIGRSRSARVTSPRSEGRLGRSPQRSSSPPRLNAATALSFSHLDGEEGMGDYGGSHGGSSPSRHRSRRSPGFSPMRVAAAVVDSRSGVPRLGDRSPARRLTVADDVASYVSHTGHSSPGRRDRLLLRCLQDLQRGHIWAIENASFYFAPGQLKAVCSTPFRLLGAEWELRIAPLPSSRRAADGQGRGRTPSTLLVHPGVNTGMMATRATTVMPGATDGDVDQPAARSPLATQSLPDDLYNLPSDSEERVRHGTMAAAVAAAEDEWLGLFLFPQGHALRMDVRVIAFSEVTWAEWQVTGWTPQMAGKGWGLYPFLQRRELMRTDKLARDNIVKICVAPISDLY